MENETFHLEYNRWIIKVEKIPSPNKSLFKVHFPNEIPDMILEKTIVRGNKIVWKTVVAGMENMGQDIGLLIDKENLA